MKALVKADAKPGFELKEMDVPRPGPGQVLIKVKGTCICGSDIHMYHSSPGIMRQVSTPVIVGHETCGEVMEVGDCVSNVQKGDLVSPEPHIFCGECYYCQTGAALNCQRMELFGLSMNGAFAEYAAVPASACWKHAKDMPADLGSIHEPLGVAVHGVMAADINAKTVAVFGCGPIGLFAIGASKVFGATRVFGLEIAPKRLEMARKLFPDVTFINPKEQDAVPAIQEATDGLGVDVSIELSGSAEATRLCFKALRREGRVSLVGVPAGPIEFDFHPDIILKEARVHGVFGRVVWQTWWQVKAMLETGKFDPLPIVTHRFPLEQFKEAFELAESGQAGKIILYP